MKKRSEFQKILRSLMKCSLLQVFMAILFTGISMAGGASAQELLSRKVSLKAENRSIDNILGTIEKQVRVKFTYRTTLLSESRRVSVDFRDKLLSEVLEELLTPLQIRYRIVGRQIVLTREEFPAMQPPAASPDRAAPAENKVRGTVKDDNGEPLPGVSILVKGTQSGTTTDAQGKFEITVPDERALLQFSFVGFRSRELTVGSQTNLEVVLEVDEKSLDEVIVVGYGSVKKQNLTSSVSKIDSEAISGRPIPTLSEAFAGQLAGVRAQNTSGVPGQELQIRIRGVNTINGDGNPLYVIDGVPRDGMGDINPSDVASIQILKDAAATAIYGARGGNGVVLIETKQGQGKPSFNFDAFYGFQQPEKFIKLMSKEEWLAYNIWYRNESYLRQGGSMKDPMSARPESMQVPDSWLDPSLKGVDWQRAIMTTAPIQSYQLSGSTKSDLGSIYMSGGYLDQGGIVYNTYYRRMNFRLNGVLNVGKKMKVGMNLSPSFSTQDDRDSQGKETVIHHAIMQSPLVQLNSATRDWGFPAGLTTVYPNPLERLKYTTDKTTRNVFSSVVWGEYEVIPHLVFRTQFGFNTSSAVYEWFQSGNVSYNNGNLTTGNTNSQSVKNWSIQNTLTYDRKWEDHELNLMVGQSAEDRQFYRVEAVASGWPNDLIETLNVATTPTKSSSDRNRSKIASFFGRASYNFREKYLLNATLRRDGSSRFGSNQKWGIFPAVSAGWKLNEEGFLRDVNWLSLLKLRVSWGTSGNDRIGNYDYMAKLAIANASWGNAVVGGLIPSNIENPDLKWESTATRDIGLDISAFNNRVQLNVDYYINKTSNLLFNQPIPNTTGFGNFRTNIGSVRNSGWEIDLTTINTTGGVGWSTSLNLSRNRNKVLSMGDVDRFIVSNWDAQFITRVGGPVSQFYVYRTDGLLTEADFDEGGKAKVPVLSGQIAGNVRFIDQDGDNKISANDLVPYGNNLPDLMFGMTNRVKWKSFEFSVLLQGQLGGDVMFLGQRQVDNGASNINNFSRWVRAWKPDYEALFGPGENPVPDDLGVDMSWDGVTPYVRGNKGDNNSDLRIYDASFIRIKNIALHYTFPRVFFGRQVFKAARAFVTIDNLKTFDRYPGVTPESNSFGNATTQMGVDYSTYPLSKKFTLGLNLTF